MHIISIRFSTVFFFHFILIYRIFSYHVFFLHLLGNTFHSWVILPYFFPFFFIGTMLVSKQSVILDYQNITFDGIIIILWCSTNIKCDCTFVTFGNSFFFFLSHLMIPSSYYTVSTSHVTVLLSHFVVPLFLFSYLMVSSSHYTIPTSHVTVFLSHSVVPLFFSYI